MGFFPTLPHPGEVKIYTDETGRNLRVYITYNMDKRKYHAAKNHEMILKAVAQALDGAALTKVELIQACPSVVIDNNTLEMLRNSGAITITRGRYARISLTCPKNFIHIRIEEFVKGMIRNSQKEEQVEKRVLTEKADLKAAFKRSEKKIKELQEELDMVYSELGKLEVENKRMKAQLTLIKEALK